MSLSSVLVDRARVVRYTVAMAGTPPAPVRVEGTTQMTWVYGEWFACRIDAPEAAESADSAAGRVRTDQHRTLIFELEDEAGGAVVMNSDDRVQIESEELGLETYELVGQPTLFRKKTVLVAGQVDVKVLLQPTVAGMPSEGEEQIGVGTTGTGAVV